MKALKQVILLGIFFLILVTTYNSFSFIVTYMYEHKDKGFKEMGPVLLAANYFTFLIANSFAPSIRMSLTSQMKVAAICYTLNYVSEAFLLPGNWGIAFSVVGAMVGGYGAALLWVCYGAYMKTLCKVNGEEDIQGRYFGILNAIAFSSLLCGSLVTTFCFQLFSDQTYFIILSALGTFSLISCYTFIKQVSVQKTYTKPHNWVLQLKKSLKFYSKMKSLIPLLIFDGLILGFISTSSTKLMPIESSRVDIGIFLIVLGAGCIVGGFVSGYLSDLISMKNAGRLAVMAVLVVSVATVFVQRYLSMWVAFVIAFFWGVVREYMEGWLYVACSRNFNGRLQSYANMKQLHSLSFCIYQGIVIATQLNLPIQYFMLIFILLSPICFYFLKYLPQPQIQNQLEEIRQQKIVKLESSSEQET